MKEIGMGGFSMELKIKNIGKIEEANIELNGITVIAGINNSAKSTVGKVLYSIFNSFYKLKEQIYKEKIDSINRTLYRSNRFQGFIDASHKNIFNNILDESDRYIEDMGLLKSILTPIFEDTSDKYRIVITGEDIDNVIEDIIDILRISDHRILETLIYKRLNAEFNGQINNIYSPNEKGEIKLKIRDEEISVIVTDNSNVMVSNDYNLNTEVIYIDDPFVLDETVGSPFYRRNRFNLNHREHLKSKLVETNNENIIDELIISDKLDSIFQKINSVCSGEMIKHKSGFGYKKDNSDAILDIKNISTGLKTFVIVKTLLQNGSLEENGTIILDEPEIHLHPEWQLILAELIVLIQKEFGMHILLNTHSPYFLRALEVYSANYEIADRCKYYLSENINDKSIIKDVTTHTDIIYKKLAQPLEKLQIERYNND